MRHLPLLVCARAQRWHRGPRQLQWTLLGVREKKMAWTCTLTDWLSVQAWTATEATTPYGFAQRTINRTVSYPVRVNRR